MATNHKHAWVPPPATSSHALLRAGTGAEGEDGGLLERLLGSLAGPAELAAAAAPRLPPQTLRVLAQFAHNDLLLASMGISREVRAHACLPLLTFSPLEMRYSHQGQCCWMEFCLLPAALAEKRRPAQPLAW